MISTKIPGGLNIGPTGDLNTFLWSWLNNLFHHKHKVYIIQNFVIASKIITPLEELVIRLHLRIYVGTSPVQIWTECILVSIYCIDVGTFLVYWEQNVLICTFVAISLLLLELCYFRSSVLFSLHHCNDVSDESTIGPRNSCLLNKCYTGSLLIYIANICYSIVTCK